MQMRAARYVIQLVILILRYCDRVRKLGAPSGPLAGFCVSCAGAIGLLAENNASPNDTAAAAVSVQAKKKNGAKFSSFLHASDIGAHENHLGEPARVRRDRGQLHCRYLQGALCNDGSQQNADRAKKASRTSAINLRWNAKLV